MITVWLITQATCSFKILLFQFSYYSLWFRSLPSLHSTPKETIHFVFGRVLNMSGVLDPTQVFSKGPLEFCTKRYQVGEKMLSGSGVPIKSLMNHLGFFHKPSTVCCGTPKDSLQTMVGVLAPYILSTGPKTKCIVSFGVECRCKVLKGGDKRKVRAEMCLNFG